MAGHAIVAVFGMITDYRRSCVLSQKKAQQWYERRFFEVYL